MAQKTIKDTITEMNDSFSAKLAQAMYDAYQRGYEHGYTDGETCMIEMGGVDNE